MDIFSKKQKPVDFGVIETVIGGKTKVKGEINCEGPLRISGEIDGKIATSGDVFIDEKSKIKGDVVGERVVVAGEITGNVTGLAGLEIEKTGIVHGDLAGDKLIIEEGATYKGKVFIGAKSREKHKRHAETTEVKAVNPSNTTEVYQLFQQNEN